MRAFAGSTLLTCGAASSGPAHPALPMASSAAALRVSSSNWPLQLRAGVRVRGIHAVTARLPMGPADQAWRSFLALRSGVPESYRTALRSARAGRIAQQVRSRSVGKFKIPHYLRKSPRPRRAGGCGVPARSSANRRGARDPRQLATELAAETRSLPGVEALLGFYVADASYGACTFVLRRTMPTRSGRAHGQTDREPGQRYVRSGRPRRRYALRPPAVPPGHLPARVGFLVPIPGTRAPQGRRRGAGRRVAPPPEPAEWY